MRFEWHFHKVRRFQTEKEHLEEPDQSACAGT